jgi:L-ascorbate 6-phosphate lactonase
MADIMQQILNLPIIPNSMALWGFGQMGVGIKTAQSILYIDLCLSDVVREREGEHWKRAYVPPIAPEAISKADYYLVTHEHLDHLDPLTIAPILRNNPATRFVAPGWCKELLLDIGIEKGNIIVPPVFECIALPDSDVHLTAIPTAHYKLDYHDEKGYRWYSYLIEANGVRFYHSGDTIIYPEFRDHLKALPKADVALLPVNGRDYYREIEGPAIGNLMPVEAVRLMQELGWDTLIIGHNDMYPFNCTPYSETITALERLAPRQKYKVLQPGELYYFAK